MNPGIRNRSTSISSEDVDIATRNTNDQVNQFMEGNVRMTAEEFDAYDPNQHREPEIIQNQDMEPEIRLGINVDTEPRYEPTLFDSPSASPIARPQAVPTGPVPFTLDEFGRRSPPRITNETNWHTPRRRPRVIRTPGAPTRRNVRRRRRARRMNMGNRLTMHHCPFDGAYFMSRALLMDHVRRVYNRTTCPYHVIHVEFM